MTLTTSLLVLWLAAGFHLQSVLGALFVTSPSSQTTCHGGQPCTIAWLDDGRAPLLNVIGPSNFALYYQSTTLAQQLQPALDVSATRSLTFTPDPNAGPNSATYFIWITSNTLKDPNNTAFPYESFSGAFTLDGMTGSANFPVPSDVEPILISTVRSHATVTATRSTNTRSTNTRSTNGVVSTTTLPPISSASSPASSSRTSPPLNSSSVSQSSISSQRSPSTSAAGANSPGTTSNSASSHREGIKPGITVLWTILAALAIGAANVI